MKSEIKYGNHTIEIETTKRSDDDPYKWEIKGPMFHGNDRSELISLIKEFISKRSRNDKY